jgi:hypothetical protein
MVDLNHQNNIVSSYSIDISKLSIKKENICAAMGYRKNNVPDYIAGEIDAVFREINEIDDVRGGFRILFKHPLTVMENGFSIDNVFFSTGAVIASNIKGSEYIAFFLATAGNTISEKMQESNLSRHYMKAYVYDIVGSEIAECACDVIQSLIETEAKTLGLSITHRYSPGYCGWDVGEQFTLFSFLPEDFCGITLTKSALMVPVKSVSGIVGIGEKAAKRNSGCAICNMTTCYKRQKNK